VFRIARSQPYPPHLDLTTARETIAYIEDDLRRVPGLEKAADALKAAVAEMETAERASKPTPLSRFTGARFLPRRTN
jgi:hypothetical protein